MLYVDYLTKSRGTYMEESEDRKEYKRLALMAREASFLCRSLHPSIYYDLIEQLEYLEITSSQKAAQLSITAAVRAKVKRELDAEYESREGDNAYPAQVFTALYLEEILMAKLSDEFDRIVYKSHWLV